jgi:hypothetical protein
VSRWNWLLLLAGLSCTRRDVAEGQERPVQPQAEVSAAQPVQPRQPTGDVAVATRWVEALREGDPVELQASTHYPFEIHDSSGGCPARQTTARPEDLAFVLTCLSTDDKLIDLLRTHDSGAVEPLAAIHLAAWQQRWHVSANPDMRIVTAFFNRNDARVNLDMWVVDGGVRGVWKSGINGAAPIGIATRWVDALRHRDLAALTQLTRYPFEVRDTGRDARCRTRTANGPDTLESALSCLLASDQLHRALVDSPSPRMLADGALPQSLAEWARPWWRQRDHGGLQGAYAMVATTEGYEYDFQILVDRDGVRVVWKRGAFESRN